MLAVFFPLEFDLVFIGRDSSFVFLSFFFFFLDSLKESYLGLGRGLGTHCESFGFSEFKSSVSENTLTLYIILSSRYFSCVFDADISPFSSP